MLFSQRLANPARFQAFASALLPFLWAIAGLLIAAGQVLSLGFSPADYQQGQSVRIMYLHVPAAWLSLLGYSVMAAASAWGFIARHPLADVAAKAAAPVGAVFTALALLTGSLWGKPMWGAWWVWDARLTSELILLFLYLGYMALWSAIEEPARAARAAGILAIAGSVNVPIVHFSVNWWNTLHQGASVFRMGGPTIDAAMLTPLLIMALGFTVLFAALVLVRMQTEILLRRARSLRLQASAEASTS
jgi:heme exporter protein C